MKIIFDNENEEEHELFTFNKVGGKTYGEILDLTKKKIKEMLEKMDSLDDDEEDLENM